MNHSNTIQQIGQQSQHIFFQFNRSRLAFDYLSPAFYKIWKFSEAQCQELPQLLLASVVEDDRPEVLRCWRKLLNGEPIDTTVCIQQSSRKRHIRCIAYPIFDNAQQVETLAGMAEEVTQQQEFIHYLIEVGQRKNSALEIVSHDLRGPLAIANSVAALLRQGVGDNGKEELERYIEIIQKACQQCTDLIEDIVNEENLQSLEVYVNKTRVNMGQQVQEVVESYQKGQIVQQQFRLQLPDEPLMAELDPIKFLQILNNLISNSIKFTPPTGTITIRVYQEAEWAVLEHRDNGIGIPAYLLPEIFERRSSASRIGLNGEASRGLGLSIVYELVRLQGGTVSVKSQEHEGTCFTIRLPLHAA